MPHEGAEAPDADVLTHAVCDPILGAACPAISGCISDTDPAYAGYATSSSCSVLSRWRRVQDTGLGGCHSHYRTSEDFAFVPEMRRRLVGDESA